MLLFVKSNIIRMMFAQFIMWINLLVVSSCTTTSEGPDQEKLAVQRAIVVNYLNRGLANRAIVELRPLLLQYPENPDLLSLQGLAQLALNNPEDATTALRRAYGIRPNLTTGLNLSSAYIESGKFREAVQLLSTLKKDKNELARYTYPERVHHNLGLALEKQKKNSAAEKHYRAALKQNPTFYLSLMQLAGLQSRAGKADDAVALYQRAQQVCTSCLDPVEGMAFAYLKKNQTAQARKTLDAFLRRKDVDPDSRQRGELLMRKLSLAPAAKPNQ
jgi:Tfp pilus assembly protein PilF